MSKLSNNTVIVPQDTHQITNATIEKLSDDKFNGMHPNRINKGWSCEGPVWQAPIVGQSCCIGTFCTSVVTEIIDESIFKTRNSTYKIIYHEPKSSN